MKNKISLAVLSVLLSATIFLSCKKDDDSTPTPTPAASKQLIRYWDSKYQDTVSLGYDAQGRINLVDGTEDKQSTTVSGNNLHYVEFRKTENRNTADIQFTLDAQGRVSTGTGTIAYIAAQPTTTQYSFEYDAAGYCTKKTDKRADGNTYVYSYAYTDGNLTTMKRYDNGVPTFTQTNEYYTDKVDKIGLDYYHFIDLSKGITGLANKNLLKKATGVGGNPATLYWEYEYNYVLDADGYPTQLQLKRLSNGEINTTFYTYK